MGTPVLVALEPNVSNRRKLTLQRRLDLDAGLWCPICRDLAGHYPVEGHPGDWRVVTVSEDFFAAIWPDKQETPEVGPSEVSTNRIPSKGINGGRSAKFA